MGIIQPLKTPNVSIVLRRPLLNTQRRVNHLSTRPIVRSSTFSSSNVITTTATPATTDIPNVVTFKYNRNRKLQPSSEVTTTAITTQTNFYSTVLPENHIGNKFRSSRPFVLTSIAPATTTIPPPPKTTSSVGTHFVTNLQTYRSKKLPYRRFTTEITRLATTNPPDDVDEATTETQIKQNFLRRSNINTESDQIAKSSISTNRVNTVNHLTNTNQKQIELTKDDDDKFNQNSDRQYGMTSKPTQILSRVADKSQFSTTLQRKRIQHPADYYDYYDDNNESYINGQPKGQLKVVVHGRGVIECLDQGNFPHPESCYKFISCAKFETGDVVGWEYTCPTGLSFDPVGGMCNWSGGCNL